VDKQKVEISETPGLILTLYHINGILFTVVVIPELCSDEDILSIDQALINSLSDTLTSLTFVLVVVSSVKEPVADFDRFVNIICSRLFRDLPEAETNKGHFIARSKLDGPERGSHCCIE